MVQHRLLQTTLMTGCLALGVLSTPFLIPSILSRQLVAQAQQQSACLPFPPGTSQLALLQLSSLQEELKLTEWQINEVAKLEKNLKQELIQVYYELKPTSQQWNESTKRKFFVKIKDVSRAKDQQLTQILRPPQFTRLREVMIQVYGWQTLNEEESVKVLKLSRDQQNRLRRISEETNQNVLKTFQIPRDINSPSCQQIMKENRKKIEQIRQNGQKQADQILSSEQKKILRTLQGKPFNLNVSSQF